MVVCTRFFVRPGSNVKLYVSVPVVLYTVFLRPGSTEHCLSQKPWPKTLVKNLAKNPGMPTMY